MNRELAQPIQNEDNGDDEDDGFSERRPLLPTQNQRFFRCPPCPPRAIPYLGTGLIIAGCTILCPILFSLTEYLAGLYFCDPWAHSCPVNAARDGALYGTVSGFLIGCLYAPCFYRIFRLQMENRNRRRQQQEQQQQRQQQQQRIQAWENWQLGLLARNLEDSAYETDERRWPGNESSHSSENEFSSEDEGGNGLEEIIIIGGNRSPSLSSSSGSSFVDLSGDFSPPPSPPPAEEDNDDENGSGDPEGRAGAYRGSQQASGSGASSSFSGSFLPKSSTSTVSEYFLKGQLSSLVGMQVVLSEASQHVFTMLKSLVLRTYTDTSDNNVTGYVKGFTPYKPKQQATLSRANMNVMNMFQQMTRTCRVVAFTDSYDANLENKIRSSRAGLSIQATPEVYLGISYKQHKDKTREYSGVQLSETIGSVKVITQTNGVSAIVSWNKDQSGLSGHIAGCYEWGDIKNARYVTYVEQEDITKGKTAIILRGGLAQLGYTITTSGISKLTPYIEYMISNVNWNGYKETRGLFPCEVSRNQECIVEKSIGLRSDIRFTSRSQLQGWIAGISGFCKKNSLKLHSQDRFTKYKVSVPSKAKRYIKGEFGMSYYTVLMEGMSMDISGNVSTRKDKKFYDQTIGIYLQYRY